jgi:hypothetical protein
MKQQQHQQYSTTPLWRMMVGVGLAHHVSTVITLVIVSKSTADLGLISHRSGSGWRHYIPISIAICVSAGMLKYHIA